MTAPASALPPAQSPATTSRHPLAAAALAIALAAAPGLGALAARSVTVSQAGKAFSTQAVQVRRGDAVRFTNDDRFDHHLFVEAPAFVFHSAEQQPGTAIEIVFTTPGTFDVQCQMHPRMHLAVTVE